MCTVVGFFFFFLMHEITWDSAHPELTYSFHCFVSLKKGVFPGLAHILLGRNSRVLGKSWLQKQKPYILHWMTLTLLWKFIF